MEDSEPGIRGPRPRAVGRILQRVAALAIGASVNIAPAEALALTWTKGPYLQALGPTGVTIKVEIGQPTAITVEVEEAGRDRAPGQRENARQRVESTEIKAFHAVRVEGLTPASPYRYRVRAAGEVTEEGRFTTAPDPKESRPFRFIVYGDNRSDHGAHAAVVRAIESMPSDFLVHTGDMVATGSKGSDWQAFFGIERALLRDRCVFAAVGNHELAAADPEGKIAFLKYFAATDMDADGGGREREALYGSFRWSNARFFLLNAMDTWAGEDRRWLDAELSRTAEEPGVDHRFVVLHHGPFSSGPHGANARIASTGALATLRRHAVSLVLAGHDHAYERGEGAGLKYIVSGGGGAPLYQRKKTQPETRAFEATHHFVEIVVDGGAVTVEARRAAGGVLDRCSFRGRGGWDCGEAEQGTVLASALEGSGAATAPADAKASKGATWATCGCVIPGAAAGDAGACLLALPAAAALALLALQERRKGRARRAFGGRGARDA